MGTRRRRFFCTLILFYYLGVFFGFFSRGTAGDYYINDCYTREKVRKGRPLFALARGKNRGL